MAMASPGPLCMSGFENLIIVHARVLAFCIWIAGLQLGSVILLVGCRRVAKVVGLN